jgi:hypothetical protein
MLRNKFYHNYEDALAKYGYTVDDYGYVWDADGNQAAGEDNYGNVQSKDPNVTEICRAAEIEMTKAKPKPKAKTKAKKEEVEYEESLEMVRARDENGHFIADDPNTPDVNEAWVVKTVKKAVKKK